MLHEMGIETGDRPRGPAGRLPRRPAGCSAGPLGAHLLTAGPIDWGGSLTGPRVPAGNEPRQSPDHQRRAAHPFRPARPRARRGPSGRRQRRLRRVRGFGGEADRADRGRGSRLASATAVPTMLRTGAELAEMAAVEPFEPAAVEASAGKLQVLLLAAGPVGRRPQQVLARADRRGSARLRPPRALLAAERRDERIRSRLAGDRAGPPARDDADHGTVEQLYAKLIA